MDITFNKIIYIIRKNVMLKSIFKILYSGKSRYCPICKSHYRKFLPFGVKIRDDAMCLNCGSLERHRLIWKFFKGYTNIFEQNEKRMLHIAPEEVFIQRLKKIDNLNYLTADLHDPNAMIKMDITDIQYPDNQFDIIYCSHVLEHIQNDQQAMRELFRVLKPGGWAILQVPITANETFEDPSVTDPQERKKLFGQHDHVRRYGPDYKDRLKKAGFNTQVFNVNEIVERGNVIKYGLMTEEKVYYCTK